MKVTCDSCGAIYRIPEEKLTKDVSRATCKKCGAKLIIRRPGAGYDDMGLSGGGGDEDSVINHEERTVIAQVPELQKFDATPPLASGTVGNQDELKGILGNAPAAAPAAKPAPEEPKKPAPAAAKPTPAASTGSTPPVKAPAAVPGPSITVQTSPAPPSGREAPVSPQVASTPPATPPVSPGNRANVVEIFSQPKPGGPAEVEFRQPSSMIALVLCALTFLGVLAFIDKGMWGLTKVTAVGFFVAAYCSVAATVAQISVNRTGKVNVVWVFVAPAVFVAILLAALWTVQKDQLAFIHPDWDIVMVVEAITLPDAPDAPKVTLAKKMEQRRTMPRGMRRPGELAGGQPGAGDPGAAGVPAGESPVPVAEVVSPPPGEEAFVSSRTLKRPVGMADASAKAIEWDEAGIQESMAKADITKCILTSAAGMKVSGRLKLNLLISPDGRARNAKILEPADLRESQFEGCVRGKIMQTRFPTFDGTSAAWYDYSTVL